MTRVEKTLIGGLLLAVVLAIVGVVTAGYNAVQSINDNGGVKQIIIDTGKEIKDISKQIQED